MATYSGSVPDPPRARARAAESRYRETHREELRVRKRERDARRRAAGTPNKYMPIEVRREYRRQARALKQSAIWTLKMESGCVDCGYAQHPTALDFDHIDRTWPVRRVSRMMVMNRSIEEILTEIDRCVVRCANCHRVKTYWEATGGNV